MLGMAQRGRTLALATALSASPGPQSAAQVTDLLVMAAANDHLGTVEMLLQTRVSLVHSTAFTHTIPAAAAAFEGYNKALDCYVGWLHSQGNQVIRPEMAQAGRSGEIAPLLEAQLLEAQFEAAFEAANQLEFIQSQVDRAVHAAARSGSALVLERLLASKARCTEKDRRRETPLAVAMRNGHLPVATMLLKAGADPNCIVCNTSFLYRKTTRNVRVLRYAASNGDAAAVALLLRGKANADAHLRGSTAVMGAVACRQLAALKVLVRAKACVNIPATESVTPVALAAANQHANAVAVLVRAAADVNLRDRLGYTPLMQAVRHSFCVAIILPELCAPQECCRPVQERCQERVVACLIEAKVNVHAKTAEGAAALDMVVSRCDCHERVSSGCGAKLQVIQLLVGAKAHLDRKKQCKGCVVYGKV